MKKISIVIPVYNSQDTIKEVVDRVENTILSLKDNNNYEVILVNDSSKDGALEVCKQMSSGKEYIKTISFSKNFGQANALMAGFKYATGDYVICLDDDLQNPPEEIEGLISVFEKENYDVLYGVYKNKKHTEFRNMGTKINRYMQQTLINKPKNIYSSSFFIARKYVIKEVLKYNKPYPYLPGLIFRVTQNVGNIYINHNEREVGRSQYTFKKLLSLWLNGFTNFSVKPLRISSIMGICFSLISFIAIIAMIIRKIMSPSIQLGWTSIMVTIIFFGGIQLLTIGLLGEYVGRIFLCINNTPQYVIRESYNIEDSEEVKFDS